MLIERCRLLTLPPECLALALSLLEPTELVRVAMTCHALAVGLLLRSAEGSTRSLSPVELALQLRSRRHGCRQAPTSPENSRRMLALELQTATRTHIAAGSHHSVFLDSGGRLLTCGSELPTDGSMPVLGLLGLGHRNTDEAELALPTPLLGHGNLPSESMCSISVGGNHTLAMAWSGAVFSWGSGCNGKLGHGDVHGRAQPTRVDALRGVWIRSVAAGLEFSLAASSGRNLYSWGGAHGGVLGDGQREGVSHRTLPARVGLTFAEPQDGGQAPPDHPAGENTPQNPPPPPAPSGRRHCSHSSQRSATTSGDAVSPPITAYRDMRSNPASQPTFWISRLAQPRAPSLSTLPTIDGLRREHRASVLFTRPVGVSHSPPLAVTGALLVESVAAGTSHAAFVSGAGGLYTWGCGLHGRLGHGDTLSRAVPTLVSALEGARVSSVALGGCHSLALVEDTNPSILEALLEPLTATASGPDTAMPPPAPSDAVRRLAVYSWGWGMFGRLGHGNEASAHAPKRLAWSNAPPMRVAAGEAHSLCVAEDGSVWSWGFGAQGVLGHAGEEDEVAPRRIEVAPCREVSGGTATTLAVGRDGRVYGWGSCQHGALGMRLERKTRLTMPRAVSSQVLQEV